MNTSKALWYVKNVYLHPQLQPLPQGVVPVVIDGDLLQGYFLLNSIQSLSAGANPCQLAVHVDCHPLVKTMPS